MSDEVKTIELWPCGYQAPCRVKNCKARATVIARASNSIGSPITQYELCAPHAEQIAERERAKGREIVDGRTPHHFVKWKPLEDDSIVVAKAGGIEETIAFEHGYEDAQEPITHTTQGAGI